jgi:hypothetical protein
MTRIDIVRSSAISLLALSMAAGHCQAQAQAPAPPLCSSDAQLEAALISTFWYTNERMAGICVKRFPDLRPAMGEAMNSLKVYSSEFNRIARLSFELYEKSYPGHATAMQQKHEHAASEGAARQVETMSKKQCKDLLMGIQVLGMANNWSRATSMALIAYKEERERVPRCP